MSSARTITWAFCTSRPTSTGSFRDDADGQSSAGEVLRRNDNCGLVDDGRRQLYARTDACSSVAAAAGALREPDVRTGGGFSSSDRLVRAVADARGVDSRLRRHPALGTSAAAYPGCGDR